MKKLMLCLIALMALVGGAAQAQEITGTWQGILKAGKDLRVVAKFAKSDAGAWTGTFYSIDQTPQGFPVGKVNVTKDGTVTFSIAQIGGEYTGKLQAEVITGTWSQGGAGMPLVLTRVKPEAAWPIPEAPVKVKPMAADADPTFDIATIKPSKPEQQGKGFGMRGRSFTTINTTMIDLMKFAYGLQEKQILNAPAWASEDKFDLAAQPDIEGAPSDKQMKSMIAKLLKERFKLAYHHDKKELAVYAITVAKGGAKITADTEEFHGLPALYFRALGNMVNAHATMQDFAGVMQMAVLDRPVVDQTGLKGRYDFTLKWTPDESQFGGMGMKVPPPTDAADAPPGLFTAIQEQAGLKLDPTRAPVDVFVIDKVEKPSEN